jgi:hypothetical protein
MSMPLGSNGETTRGRWARTALRWGRPTCGVGRSQVGSGRAAFHLGDYQLGPQGGSRCMGWLKAVCSGCGPLNPCWTHGCVGFVGKCFSWIDDVSWTHGILCASTLPRGLVWVPLGPHNVMCISLSSGSDVCNWYIHFDVSTSPSQWCSRNRHLILFMMMPYSCH